MERKQVANTVAHRVLAWALLLAFGIGAIVGAIVVTANGYQSSLIAIDSGYGGLANVVFFFTVLSVGLALYFLRGFSTGIWSLSLVATIIVLANSVVILAFGMTGLVAIAGVGVAIEIGQRIRRNARPKDGA